MTQNFKLHPNSPRLESSNPHLVGLRLPELVCALVDPDVGGLDVLLDGVDHPALLVHHRRKVLEDRVHVDDVGLEKVEEIKTKSARPIV